MKSACPSKRERNRMPRSSPRTCAPAAAPKLNKWVADVCACIAESPAVIGYHPSGGFIVKNVSAFAAMLDAKGYSPIIDSFMRNATLYGFKKDRKGPPDVCSYINAKFQPGRPELMARIKRKASADSAATNAAFARAIVAMKALIDRHLPAVELSASVLAACEEAAELAAESPVETGEDDEAGSVEDAAEAALPPQLVPVPSAPSSAAAAAVADTQTPSSNSGGNNVEGRPAKRQRTTEEAPAAAVVPVPAAAKTPAASGRRATKSKASGASASAAPPPAAASAEAALPVAAPTVTKRGGNIKREAPVRSAAAMTSAGTYVMPSEPAETSTRPGADSPGVSASSADDAADAADAASASDEEMKEAQQEHPGIPIDQYFASLSSTQPSDYNDGAAGAAAAAAGEESAAAAALLTFPSLSQYTRVDTREMSQVAKEQAAAAEAASSSAGGSSAGTGQGAVLGWTGGDLFDEAFLRSLGRPGSLGAPAVGPPVVPRPMDGVVPNDTVITAARLAVHGGDVISRMVASGALSP